MKCRVLLVPRSRGEELRRRLVAEGWLRSDVGILAYGDRLALPLVEGASVPDGLGEIGEIDLPPRAALAPEDYRDLVSLPPELQPLLPRSFDVIGDVVLVRIPRTLEAHAGEIGRALLAFVPGARIVGEDRGVHGEARRRSLVALAGTGGWRTRHRENGIDVEVDLERAYFSPRLAREHARVAETIRPGDRVYDLCCGVGPFTLTIARDGRARTITSVDSNPDALALLRGSLTRQGFGTPVTLREGPVEVFAPIAEPVERVILNLPLEGIKYLPSVARTTARRGHLYYYEVVPRTEFDHREKAVVLALGSAGEWRVSSSHVVHPYSPTSDLVGFDLERAGEGA